MYHCPECSTEIQPAEGAHRGDEVQGGLYLETMYYNCPGCGQKYIHWQKEYANHEPVDQWFHIGPNGRTLLMHNPPNY